MDRYSVASKSDRGKFTASGEQFSLAVRGGGIRCICASVCERVCVCIPLRVCVCVIVFRALVINLTA